MNAPTATAAGSQLPIFIGNDASASAPGNASADNTDRATFANLLLGSHDEAAPTEVRNTLPQALPTAAESTTEETVGAADLQLAGLLPAIDVALNVAAAKTAPIERDTDNAGTDHIDNILAQTTLAGALASASAPVLVSIQAENPVQAESDNHATHPQAALPAMAVAAQQTPITTIGLDEGEEGVQRLQGDVAKTTSAASSALTSLGTPLQPEHRPMPASPSSQAASPMPASPSSQAASPMPAQPSSQAASPMPAPPSSQAANLMPEPLQNEGAIESATSLLAATSTGPANGSDGTAAPPMPSMAILESAASTRLGSPAVAAPATESVPLLPDTLAMDADFDDGLGQRIEWMAREGIGQARLKLTPEGMGQISIQLNLDGNRLDAQFQASHSQVRQALNASLDHLRDMLREQGVQLGNTHVGQHAQGQAQGQTEGGGDKQHGPASATASSDPAVDASADTAQPAPRWQGSARHLLDTWA